MDWKRAIGLLVLSCFTSVASGQPRSSSPDASQKLRLGIEAFEGGQYEEAIKQLSAGYARDPRPEFLYALGQSERKRGNCPKALEYYKAFLKTNPSERQAEAARLHIERCERVVAEQQSQLPPPVTTPVAPSVTTPPAPPVLTASPPSAQTHAMPWYKDWLGNALVGAGVISLGLGTLFILQGNGALDGKTTYADFITSAEDGKSQQTLGTVLLAAGGGLVAGGILRYVLHERGPEKMVVGPAAFGMGRAFALSLLGAF